MNSIEIPDKKARARIAEEFDMNFFVEAGAGSGKTRSLVDRMTGVIRQGLAGVENIAAVTFTRKAAAELRERFQIELESLLKDPKTPAPEKANVNNALSHFERANISTIHSFCARILRERPVEAGVDPGFEDLEDDQDAIYAEDTWAFFIEEQSIKSPDKISWLAEHDININSLKEIYRILIKYPDVKAQTENIGKPDLKPVKEAVKKLVFEIRKQMPEKEPESKWDILQGMVVRVIKLMHMGYLDEDRLFIKLLRIMDKKTGVTQNRWGSKELAKRMESVVVSFQANIVEPALESWQAYLHKPLVDFALEGAKYYEEWRKERSLLNFQDLLMKTATLLRTNSEVRAYFKRELRYMLVDEFQDTDPIQAEMILLLAGDDDLEIDWRNVKLKKGALFLVGDPKQSIFRFRRADIDIYNLVKEIYGKGGGEVLELTSNFRSIDPVRDLVDSVFKGVFPEEDTPHQARFAPLNTVRGKPAYPTSGVFENRIEKVEGNRAEGIAEKDAGVVAAWIKKSINGGLKLERTDDEKEAGKKDGAEPGDFMIITRYKDRLSLYAKALEALGVPYEISGGKNFVRSEELREISRVLKAVADSGNPVAVVAALRGQFFGVSDNDLYKFAKAGGRFSYFSEIKEAPAPVQKAFARLREYNDIVRDFSPVTAVEKIIEQLATIPLAVSKEIGSTKAGNIFKAIGLLGELKADTTGSFAELVDYLRDLLDSGETEEMSLFPCTTKAVRLMNLHKAKGLEAPVVILADPMGPRSKHKPLLRVERSAGESKGFFTVFKAEEDRSPVILSTPANWQDHSQKEQQYIEAEERRLDYVAVTRARNILVVSTYYEGTVAKNWEILRPYLEAMPKLKREIAEPAARKSLEVKKADWEKEKAKIGEGAKQAITESYLIRTVTGEVKEPRIFLKAYGDGMKIGSVVHKALEASGRGKREKLELLVENWLVEEGLPPEDLKLVIGKVDGILKSDLWQRMLKSKEKYFEVPFSVGKENDVFSGIIDLVFREDSGWVIVDYKTDDFEKDPARKAAYEKQVAKYAEFWSSITGEKVLSALLFRA